MCIRDRLYGLAAGCVRIISAFTAEWNVDDWRDPDMTFLEEMGSRAREAAKSLAVAGALKDKALYACLLYTSRCV